MLGVALFGKNIGIFGGEFQKFIPVLFVFGNVTARRTACPTVFVVKVSKHFGIFRMLVAGFDKLHKLFAEILGIHAAAGVHEKSAEAHFFKPVYLPEKLLAFKSAVPRPERRAAVFLAGVFKEIFVKLFVARFFVKHDFPPKGLCDILT